MKNNGAYPGAIVCTDEIKTTRLFSAATKTRAAALLLALLLCLSLAGCAKPQPAAEDPILIPVQIDRASATVSYLGPEGTYTQEACGVFFEKQGSYVPCATVQEAVQALVDGKTGYAVIPQENTIGGAVIDYVDTLIAQTEVSVVGEVELPITQNLLALPGATLAEIKTVYSHKQGIAQGAEWLAAHLPDAEVIEVSSTAEGARMVAEGNDPTCAAIAAAACADVYQLDILAVGIQNNENNKTRFYVLSMQPPATATAERLAFIAMGDAEALPELMAAMEKQNVTLITLHDRPLKTELGEYYYLIECAGCSYESYQKLSNTKGFSFRFLGCFDVE